jgi:hypothetical protein
MKQHVPSWWRHECIRRGSNSAGITCAREGREEGAAAHGVSVRARRRPDERDSHAGSRALEQLHVDLVLLAIGPVNDWNGHNGLRAALVQVRRDVHLDSKFLW